MNEELNAHNLRVPALPLRPAAGLDILLEARAARLALTGDGLRAPNGFGDQKNRQDEQLWLDGMPVPGIHKYKVVGRRISQKQSREKPRSAPLLGERAPQSPKPEHGTR
jgi:hypothetical protein